MPISNLDLSALNGINGFRLSGVTGQDRSGYSVSGAGDVDGDGFDDVIVGAWRVDSHGDNYSGASYVVFGQGSGFASNLNLSALDGTNGFRLSGVAEDDRAGISVSAAGDVNGDGFGDVIVGAFRADPNGDYSGASYVVFGKASGFASNLELSGLDGTDGFRLSGAATLNFSGFSVSHAGDVNDDGFDDLIVGAFGAGLGGSGSGASYVVFGQASGFASNLELSALDGTNGFKLSGVGVYDRSGFSVSSAGDVNGDGFDDLIVGSYFADPNGIDGAGASYVVFGKASGFASNLNLSALDGTNGFRLSGVAVEDYSGRSVSNAGDVNGDGFDDLIVSALFSDPNAYRSGESYVVFGKASGFGSNLDLSALNGINGFRISGVAASDYSGGSVSTAGDFNGDGFDDLIVGAYGADPNGPGSGASYVVYGRASGFASNLNLSALDGNNGFRLSGAAPGDGAGRSVSSAGDVNGDGFDDLIVGAQYADNGINNSGASYVVYGRDFTQPASYLWSTLSDGIALYFDPALDVLNIDDGLSAVDLDVEQIEDGPNAGRGIILTDFAGSNKSITLLFTPGADPLNLYKITSGNIVFLDGSLLLVGDNNVGVGDDGSNASLIGGAGDDLLASFGGSQALIGGGGNDVMVSLGGQSGGSGTDAFVGGSGIDALILNDVTGLTGYAVNLATGTGTVSGANPSSFTVTGIENVSVEADGATANLTGDSNANELRGDDGNDTLDGDAGDDVLTGGDGNDVLIGGDGQDTLQGNDHKDMLTGGAGDDDLNGGGGNDVLTGGDGHDNLGGGPGNDAFVFSSAPLAGNSDEISDYQSGADSIRLDAAVLTGLVQNGVLDPALFTSGLGVSAMPVEATTAAHRIVYETDTGWVNYDSDGVGGAAAVRLLIMSFGAGPVTLSAADFVVFNGIGVMAWSTLIDGSTVAFDAATDILNFDDGSISGSEPGFTWTGDDVMFSVSGKANPLLNKTVHFTITGGGRALTDANVTYLNGSTLLIGDNTADIGDGISTFDDAPNTLIGGAGGDQLIGLGGDDSLSGGSGNDLVLGGLGNDVLHGNVGADTLVGGDGDDQLFGDNGNDTIAGGLGADNVNGNNGFDTVDGGGGNDTIHGGTEFDLLSGGDGDDLVAGDKGNDTLDGGDGNDNVQGGIGNDWLAGGAGNDTLDGGTEVDTADYRSAPGAAIVDLLAGTASDGYGFSDTLVLIENVTGSAFNDTLTGDGNANVLDGRAGDDSLSGGSGNDLVLGGLGNDVLHGNVGADTLAGEDGNDQLLGDNGNDTIAGGAGADNINGNNGFDTVDGGAGNDTLHGGTEFDLLFGGDSDDQVFGDKGDDTVVGGAGDDTLVGGIGVDVFRYDAVNLGTGDVTANGHDVISDGTGELLSLLGLNDDLAIGGTALNALSVDTELLDPIDGSTSVAFTGGVLQIDVNLDGSFNAADDFQITLTGVTSVTYNATDDLFHLA